MQTSTFDGWFLAGGLLAFGAVSACSSEPSRPERHSNGGGSGAGGGASGSAGGGGMTNVPIIPDPSGWVEGIDNVLGIQGSWYPYGDQYGVAKCLNVGLHKPEECSLIVAPPPPPAMGFVNEAGVMCTQGETAVILPCAAGLTTSGCPDHDFSNMWGAGIGFDFNANKGGMDGDGLKKPWNPDAHGVTGISFEINKVPGAKLRVEFPLALTDTEAQAVNLPPGSNTDDHPDGAPYWGADRDFKPSPVLVSPEVNVIRWDQVKKPGTAMTYVFDRARMLGIQFHVPAVNTAPRGAYDFCVKNLTFLRE